MEERPAGGVESIHPKMMIGGMVSSTLLTLLVIPAIYMLVKEWQLKRGSVGRQGKSAQQ